MVFYETGQNKQLLAQFATEILVLFLETVTVAQCTAEIFVYCALCYTGY